MCKQCKDSKFNFHAPFLNKLLKVLKQNRERRWQHGVQEQAELTQEYNEKKFKADSSAAALEAYQSTQ